MRIAFWHYGTPCHPWSVHLSPLGGTESAMLFTAEALAARGHDVHVYTALAPFPSSPPAEWPPPRASYHALQRFERDAHARPFDIFIGIRQLLPFLAGRFARVHVLWTPDACDQPFVNAALPVQFQDGVHTYDIGLYSLRHVQSSLDAILFVGAWQAKTMAARFQLDEGKCFLAYNGVHRPHFHNPQLAARRRQLVYCSTPFRGLDYLLEYFPAIRARVPDATCCVMSGMQLYGASAAEDHAQYAALYALARQAGVELLAPLAKPAMAQQLAQSRVLAYPNTFAETFCIAALEAQTAGLPIVTSQLGALPERVTHDVDGYLIPGHPSDAVYRDAFIEHVVALLTDDALWQRMHEQLPMKVDPFAYETLAAHWEETFAQWLARAPTTYAPPTFTPTAQSCDVVVDGYPKHLTLSAALIARHLAAAYAQLGFTTAAQRMMEKIPTT